MTIKGFENKYLRKIEMANEWISRIELQIIRLDEFYFKIPAPEDKSTYKFYLRNTREMLCNLKDIFN